VTIPPAFTSVGVTLVIKGCVPLDGVGGVFGSGETGGPDAVEGSDVFLQPKGSIAASKATMIKIQRSLFNDMIVSSE
jgi:hypothetical protein